MERLRDDDDDDGLQNKRQRKESGSSNIDEQSTEQMSSLTSKITAQSRSAVVAPGFSHSTIQGSINIIVNNSGHCTFGSDSSPYETQPTKTRPEVHQNDSILEGHISSISCKLKDQMENKYKYLYEGAASLGKQPMLSSVYTEICITDGDSEGVNNEHEVWQIEDASRTCASSEISVNVNDIFKVNDNSKNEAKTVLTKGIAGIGKTVSVQKFIFDWAKRSVNQDIIFLFTFPFRELNTMQGQEFSVATLIHHFYPVMNTTEKIKYEHLKILFIFDGLDECQFPLEFNNNFWYDVEKELPLDVLLTNLIRRKMLPSSLCWITTRPAAANQIPPENVQKVTEIQGFNDAQKEEYFRKKINDRNLFDRIITHIKSSRSLYIMCHIPIFCWISAYVLEKILAKQDNSVPKTLTEMYSQFVLIQTKIKNKKYGSNEMDLSKLSQEDITIIVNLGKLAFQQLEKGNIIFYKEDLDACGVDDREASVHSGVCTAVFKEEVLLFHIKVYCFVHLTVQEYLAAFYVFYLFSTQNLDVLRKYFKNKTDSLDSLLKAAVDKALQSKNGHLDLFLRFLFGISLDSNKRILQGLLPSTTSSSESIKKTIQYVKVLKRKELSPERCINLIHCLVELRDSSLVEEIQNYSTPKNQLSPIQCSALAYILMMSESLDEFDMNKYNVSDIGLGRLVPVMKMSRMVRFGHLSETACKTVASAFQPGRSNLIELHINHGGLRDEGLESLCTGLKSPHCKLLILDLSFNKLTPSGVKLLCSVLMGPHCKLEVLDLSNTDLGDSGLNVICEGLARSQCKLQTLRLSGCQVTEVGCKSLELNISHLKELDLSYNHPGDSGVKILRDVLEDPSFMLEKLNVDHGGECRIKSGPRKYACHLTLDSNTANGYLSISNGEVKREKQPQQYPSHPERFDYCNQVLCIESLRDRCYWETELQECEACVGVAYKTIGRKGASKEVKLGQNSKSWCLQVCVNKVSVHHDGKCIDLAEMLFSTFTVGVYLDWAGSTLSFYRVSAGELTHLHTFRSKFTEPLYAGFRVWTPNKSVFLCQMN